MPRSGDIVEGTGLSDATPVPGELIYPIIQTMPYAGTVSFLLGALAIALPTAPQQGLAQLTRPPRRSHHLREP